METEFKDTRIRNTKVLTIASSSIKDNAIKMLTHTLYSIITETQGQTELEEKEMSI